MQPPDWDEIASDAEGRPGAIITDLDAHREEMSVLVVAWMDLAGHTWYFDYTGADVTILGMLAAIEDVVRKRIRDAAEGDT